MTTRLYMVRHAESPFAFGQEETRGLSPEGREEAKRIVGFFEGVGVDCIASSHYTRAVDTVRDLALDRGLPIVEFAELRERAIKGLDYKAPWEELLAAIERSFTDLDYALAGGETTREAQQRAVPIIEQLLAQYRGQTIVIGTHGNIMTIIMNYYSAEYGFDFWQQTSKPDIYLMTFDGERLEAVERVWSER
ncbi:histidine phosphatase family protein [Paenibacillaceae bacterium]|nr:histidine phosphatase family protein [Paenibacillaceae bacterium]